MQIGLGVRVSGTDADLTQGAFQATQAVQLVPILARQVGAQHLVGVPAALESFRIAEATLKEMNVTA